MAQLGGLQVLQTSYPDDALSAAHKVLLTRFELLGPDHVSCAL